MPPKRIQAEPDRGLRFLEEKLSIYANGPAQTRRNHALDLLTGRIPDERVPPSFGALALAPLPVDDTDPKHRRTPPTLVLQMPQLRVTPRPGGGSIYEALPPRPSVWIEPVPHAQPRLRLIAPPLARRSRLPGRGMLGLALGAAVVGLAVGVGVRVVSERVAPRPILVSLPVAVEPVAEPTSLPVPTLAPVATVAAVAPAPVEKPLATVAPAAPAAAAPAAAAGPALADQFSVLLDERFTSNARGWLDQPNGSAYLVSNAYHLEPRLPGQFVAVSVPGVVDLQDVVLSATFRKLSGPIGGGYGLIVRDQHAGPRDGRLQTGRFYVFEIGDRGEMGVWLRDGEQWLDLLPWTTSDVVKPGTAANELTVSAIGDRLSFMVNGVPVASQRDSMLQRGGLGVFTGGDGNHVSVERLTVRVPR